jgi:hypothetical protein
MGDRADIVFKIDPYEDLDDYRDMTEFRGMTIAGILWDLRAKYPVSPLTVADDIFIVNGVRINPDEYELQLGDEVRIVPGPRLEPLPRPSAKPISPQALERFTAAVERITAPGPSESAATNRRGRRTQLRPGQCQSGTTEGAEEDDRSDHNDMPREVSTAQAAEILGVSKDTVIAYKRKGLLPFRNLAAPGSTKPMFAFPWDAVIQLRTTYQTEQPAPPMPKEPQRRRVKGRRQFKHLDLDD